MRHLLAAAGIAVTALSLTGCEQTAVPAEDTTATDTGAYEAPIAEDPLGAEMQEDGMSAETMMGQEDNRADSGAMTPVDGQPPLTPPEEQPQDGR